MPLAVTACQHPAAIVQDDHPSGVSLDTAFEKCAHERQVVVAIKNFSAAVFSAVSCDEFDAVLPSIVSLITWQFSRQLIADEHPEQLDFEEGVRSVARHRPATRSSADARPPRPLGLGRGLV